MKLDILAIAAHPDDVEISCAGTLLKHIAAGKKCGIIDLTQGEMGTRGNTKLRLKEASAASKILGVVVRDNLKMEDALFLGDNIHRLHIIKKIRQYRPEIVLCNAVHDRHPDHGRAARLASEACFYSGLVRLETTWGAKKQLPWRPKALYHYIQDKHLKPDFVVDVTSFVEQKMQAIQAYSSQFYTPRSKEPETPISVDYFMDYIKANMMVFGRDIGCKYAEGFTVDRSIGVNNLFDLI